MQDDKLKEKKHSLEIEIDDKTGEGIYSNLAVITHSNSDFVLDFIRVMPGLPKAKVKSRVILNPDNAKRLMLALQDNIRKFEAIHGSIKSTQAPPAPSFPFHIGDGGTEA